MLTLKTGSRLKITYWVADLNCGLEYVILTRYKLSCISGLLWNCKHYNGLPPTTQVVCQVHAGLGEDSYPVTTSLVAYTGNHGNVTVRLAQTGEKPG